MYEPKQLFDFMLDRVEEVGSDNGLKSPQAFGRWFADMYFDKPWTVSDMTIRPICHCRWSCNSMCSV